MRTWAHYSIFVLAAVAVACGQSSPASPTTTAAVTVSNAAVKSMHVTGPALVVGDTKQFTAMATFVDGAQQDVTSQSTWTSSDTRIATVDATGKVTAIKEGGVSIHATFRGATDSEYHNVTPLLFFKAAGTVTEVPPGFSAVPNARIEIVGGSNMGTVVISDSGGNFSFGTMRGDDYTLKITRDGYQDLTQKVTLTRDIANISIQLFPNPPAGATARCKDKSWSFATDKASACTRNGGVAYWVCPGPFCS
jgi:Bacterial Ig-like domain (group 2)/Carboxypeptidase regulatory-like domain/Protein of unknown function (DUF3761)